MPPLNALKLPLRFDPEPPGCSIAGYIHDAEGAELACCGPMCSEEEARAIVEAVNAATIRPTPLNVPTAEELAELQRLLDAATPGEWTYKKMGMPWVYRRPGRGHLKDGGCRGFHICTPGGCANSQDFADAKCIAAAHNALPKLLNAATRLAEVEAENQALRKQNALMSAQLEAVEQAEGVRMRMKR
jgi:hypothetical protein